MFTIKDLIKILKEYPEDTPVGQVGHYGEFYEMSPDDFGLCKAYCTAEEWRKWNNRKSTEVDVFQIATYNIGDYPD